MTLLQILSSALHTGDCRRVERLLDSNIDVNTTFARGASLLHVATQVGNEAMMKLLLDRNADIEAVDDGGSTALHVAAQCGHEHAVQVLLDRSAFIEAEDRLAFRPLHQASRFGNRSVVRLLINRNAEIDAVNVYNCTALHWAAYTGNEPIALMLIDLGADLTIVNVCHLLSSGSQRRERDGERWRFITGTLLTLRYQNSQNKTPIEEAKTPGLRQAMIERGMADKPRVRVRGVVWLTSQHEHQRSSYNSHARVGSTKTTSLDAKPPLGGG
jgi:ankyrin repeat protein